MFKCTLLAVAAMIAISSCSVIDGSGEIPQNTPLEHSTEPHSTYAAPTLPPAYTSTPTITRTPRPSITPTPFTIVTIAPSQLADSVSPPAPTLPPAFGPWERIEDSFLNISVEIPPGMKAVRSGRSLLINAVDGEAALTLMVELRVDPARASRFPQGVDPTNAVSVLDGMLRETESASTILNVIRPVTEVTLGGEPGASAALRTRVAEDEEAESTLRYLAAIVHNGETVVRVLSSAPESAGVTSLALAERVAESIQFSE
ncbi:MAG: hypothetical protein P8X64_04635 [Anaerolineales bacterium]|jgi:hypothetical protein